MGFPGGASGEEPACQCRRCRRHGLYPWVRKIPWRRRWHPLHCSCMENPMDRGAWQDVAHGVANMTEHTARAMQGADIAWPLQAPFHLVHRPDPFFFLLRKECGLLDTHSTNTKTGKNYYNNKCKKTLHCSLKFRYFRCRKWCNQRALASYNNQGKWNILETTIF